MPVSQVAQTLNKYDNDNDYVPDYNAWVQPISQADFDPSCFRLIRTSGVLTITGGGGVPTILPFEESLYFTNLPDDNTNVRGEVYYSFLALDGPCSTALSPYQEVASGFDNEKFNGDYGAGLPVNSLPPSVEITKTSAPSIIGAGQTTTYTLEFANTGDRPAGLTLGTSGINMPLVISDTVPHGMQLAAAATYNISNGITATIRYSTDSGANWSTTAPVGSTSTWPNSKIIIQWWLNEPLPAGSSGNYARYQATVPSGYTGEPVIWNTACIGLGDADPFACDDDLLKVTGTNVISGTVFEDDAGGNGNSNNFANKVFNSEEGTISGIAVTLYISTTQGWVVWDTTTSDGSGNYIFSDLPDGNYRVDVGSVQSTNPGWTNTTDTSRYVDLDSDHATTDPVISDNNDFGFAPALTLDKALLGPSPALEDQLVFYTIELDNNLPGDGTATAQYCQYTLWGSSTDSNYTEVGGNKEWAPYQNALGASGPDEAYASSEFANTDELIGVTNYALGTQSGALEQVDVLMAIEIIEPTLYPSFRPTDELRVRVIDTQGTSGTGDDAVVHTETYRGNTLNSYTEGVPFTLEISNISTSTITLSGFNGSRYVVELMAHGAGGQYNNYIDLDAVGFRITTDQTCGGDQPNTTIDPLPLTDTYDAAKLTFYSADPTQTSVTTGGSSPYANTGSIYWNNLGPLYAGGTEVVTVTFRVQDGTYDSTITNTATVDNAYFTNGNPTNDATDSVTNTVQQTARLGDRVWNDFDGDGVQDAGEVGFPGVVITLTADVTITVDGVDYAPGTQITTTTDEDGEYLFSGLLDGTYTVAVDTATLPGTTFTPTVDFDNDSVNDNSTNVVVSGGTVTLIGGQACSGCELDVDFGYQVPNTIMGNVWQDHDSDANRDPGDDGFDGVTVRLYDTSDTLIATTTTNPDGSYLFSDLPNGSYYVLVVTSTLPYASEITWTQTVDPDASLNDRSGTIPVSGGQVVTDVDFAYHQEGDYTLAGTVYADWNDNADLDTGEPGFSGITVTLYASSGAAVATTTTDANGAYTFTDLITDTYTVVVDRSDIPSQYGQTEDPDETGACVGIACDSQAAAVTVNAANSNVTDVDFGYVPNGLGAIGDTVWRDMNGDGLQAGPQETGIAGITVTLQIDLNGDGNWVTVETAVTDADGKYLFDNLPDGSYRVVVNTSDPDIPEGPGGYTYVPSTVTTYNRTISGGNTYLDADFGFSPLAVVGDMVYYDANANGDQDLNETGISGVEVRLYNDNSVTVTIGGVDVAPGGYISTTTSDGSGDYPAGWYQFAGLGTGGATNPYTYTVQVMPGTRTQTADPDRDGVPCAVSDPNYTACDNKTTVAVFPGTVFLGADFGYQATGVIGDYVWYDGDGDGVQDDTEVGIAGLVVTATNGTATYTTITDYDGGYTFANLPDGTWAIEIGDYDDGTPFTLTATLSSTNAITNGVGSMGSRAVSVTLSGGVVTGIDLDQNGSADVTPAQCGGCSLDLNIDFGFRQVGAYNISGTVFFDAGDDGGLYNSGTDTPYEGITVYLWQDGALLGTTTTDANGYYEFLNLPNGDYVVSVDRNSPQLSGMDQNTPTPTPYHRPVTIEDADQPGQDFGYHADIDYGDLPDGYNTTVANEGAGHITSSLRLGIGMTPETNGQPGENANFDADDGINLGGQNWIPGTTVNITATVSGTNGYLVGWFDWNNDGSFSADEMEIFGDVANGANALSVEIPSDADTSGGCIYMRFRLYDSTTLTYIAPTGLADGGEVEDYRRDWHPLAVTLASFSAAPYRADIMVRWETANEIDNLGFFLYRREAGTQELIQVSPTMIPAQAPGQGQGASYSYLDTGVRAGLTYEFFLEDVDADGTRTQHGPVSARAPFAVFLPLVHK